MITKFFLKKSKTFTAKIFISDKRLIPDGPSKA